MRMFLYILSKILLINLILASLILSSCSVEDENPINYPSGAFPDTVLNMGMVNSQYDDYNLDAHILTGSGPIVFSSNRNSSGGQFDLVQGNISFFFDQTDAYFELNSSISNDPYLNTLTIKANTTGDDFGPYRFFSSSDGYEYLVLSSLNEQGNLDLKYLRNRPQFNQNIPDIEGPASMNLFNSEGDDAYFSLNTTQDTAYFCSSRPGNFDIYLQTRPEKTEISTWFIQNPSSSAQVESLNSPADDKCPMVMNRLMVFTSNRPGGLGGFDLYYSVLSGGRWSSPVNFGPGINTSSNEYRPLLGWHENFTNYFLMFSSDRPGGEGGYDLYFTGVDLK